MERAPASHDPPLTVVQLQALRAIDGGRVLGAGIARGRRRVLARAPHGYARPPAGRP